LLLLRLAIGFLLGTDYVVSKALLTEFVPRRLRGRILGALSVAWAGGYACAYAVGFELSGLGPASWRWMLVTGAVPCLLIAPLRIMMPESPLWLANHGHADRAAQIVRARLGNSVRPPAPIAASPAARAAGGNCSPALAGAYHRRCVFFACQVIPYFAVGTFVTQVMSALNLKGGAVGA